jgi:hypothetical protein
MLSILEREPVRPQADRTPDRVVSIDEGRVPVEETLEAGTAEETADYEIVMGRRQIASVLFLGTVILVAFSAASYLAGKSTAPQKTVVVTVPAPAVTPAPAITPAAAPVVPAPAVEKPKPQSAPEAPLFGEAKTGLLYIQLGAVEKGMAIIMAEGLRKEGLNAFVAPGPNDHIFRVLIGPLDGDGYKKAKDSINALGLAGFERKAQQ